MELLNRLFIEIPPQELFYLSKIVERYDNLFRVALFVNDIFFVDGNNKDPYFNV
jgi:hypothetical protein